MHDDVAELIDAWFAKREDDGFVRGGTDVPYSVIGPSTEAERIIFTTKPMIVSLALSDQEMLDQMGIIGRPGLPTRTDLDWISLMIGQRELLFLGDMDPVDLMVFAWLRATLPGKHVGFLGISDSLLKAASIPLTTTYFLSCAPSEQQSLAFLRKVLPELTKTVGSDCADMLQRGRKRELEGIGDRRTRARVIAQAVSQRGIRE